MNILQAIAHVEGFYVPGSRSGRNNNPGDIVWGAFAREHGATRVEEIPAGVSEQARFAYFPTADTGFAAMKSLLQVPGVIAHDAQGDHLTAGYAGANIRECLCRWAPPTDGNNCSAYEAAVCRLVGCQPTDCIDSYVQSC